MNAIEIYDVLKHIPNVRDEQARSMADTMAKVDTKELATKADLQELENRMLKQQMVIAGIILAGMAVLNAGMVLFLRFLFNV